MSRMRFASSTFVVLAVASIVSAGRASTEARSVAWIARDAAFGTAGVVESIGRKTSTIDAVWDAAVDGQGRLVVCGGRYRGRVGGAGDTFAPAVARLLPDGRPDRTFGKGGVTVLRLDGIAKGVAVDGDGRIVVVGTFAGRPQQGYIAARLLADGRLDRKFGTSGLVRYGASVFPVNSWFGGEELKWSAADGSMIFGRHGGRPLRIAADGTIDPVWGRNAPAIQDSFDVDSKGRVVLGTGQGVARLSADGQPDLGFGTGGVLRAPDGKPIGASSVRVDDHDRTLLLEWGSVVRYLEDGSPDASFDVDGRAGLANGIPAAGTTYTAGSLVVGPGRFGVVNILNLFDPPSRNVSSATRGGGAIVELADESVGDALDVYVHDLGVARPGWNVHGGFWNLCFAPDGRRAWALGGGRLSSPSGRTTLRPLVVALDLTNRTIAPRPGFEVRWQTQPLLTYDQNRYTLGGSLTLSNTAASDMPAMAIEVFLSNDNLLDAGDAALHAVTADALPAGASRSELVQQTAIANHDPPGVTGKYLIAVVNRFGWARDAGLWDGIAVSGPLP